VQLDNKSRSGGTYTLSVITVQSMVIHHLYQNDQFFGFSGSSGPSHVTTFGSVLGLGRKGSGFAEELFFAGGSCGSLPPSNSKRASSRSVPSFIASCSSCKIVVVEEYAGEADALVLVLVREEEREKEDMVRGLQGSG
jgi:hypothetical protein